MKMLQRIGIIAAAVFFLLAATVVVMFALGKPVTVQAPPEAAAPASAAPAGPAAGAAAPEASGSDSDPLAIEIPGCVCHSDDPAVVAEHATYRMSECFGCHQDGMPTMGQ